MRASHGLWIVLGALVIALMVIAPSLWLLFVISIILAALSAITIGLVFRASTEED